MKPITAVEEDRHAHNYVFRCTATGGKLCLLLNRPKPSYSEGALAVLIAPLSADEIAAEEQAQQEQAAKRQQEAEDAALRLAQPFRGVMRFSLQPPREAFTPHPLLQGERYQIELRGVYRYSKARWIWRPADACYYAPEVNFDHGYEILFDGQSVKPYSEDRHTHTYMFAHLGADRKLSILLKPPENASDTEGQLDITVIPSSPQDLVAQQQALKEDKRRKDQAEKRRQEEQRREETEQCAAELEKIVRDYQFRAHAESNLLDAEFRLNMARSKTAEVLETKRQYKTDYYRIHDNELLPLIREQAPEVLAWLAAWHALIQLAEQIDTTPTVAMVTPPPAKTRKPRQKKESEEQYRARRTRRLKRGGRDKAAELTAKLELKREAYEKLKREHPYLDEDECEQLAQEYLDDLEDDGNPQGKRLD